MPAVVTTYSYTTGTDPSGSWSSDAGAFDGATGTPAVCAVGSKGTNWSAKYLQASGNNVPTTGDIPITAVSIGLVCQITNANQVFNLVPVWTGTTVGTTILVDPSATTPTTVWTDITSRTGAPATWTWDAVNALDIRVFPQTSMTAAGPSNCYVDRILINVTAGISKCLNIRADGATSTIGIFPSTANMSKGLPIRASGLSGFVRLEPTSAYAGDKGTKLRVQVGGTVFTVCATTS